MTKLTYIGAIDNALNGILDTETVEKLNALKASIAKRNASDKKPTKTQKENEAIKAEIINFLSDNEKHTVSEIMAGVPSLTTNQKATALVSALVKAQVVNREEIKRKAYFSLA